MGVTLSFNEHKLKSSRSFERLSDVEHSRRNFRLHFKQHAHAITAHRPIAVMLVAMINSIILFEPKTRKSCVNYLGKNNDVDSLETKQLKEVRTRRSKQ